MAGRFMNDELEKVWKEVSTHGLIYLLSYHFPGSTDENHKKPQLP